MKIQSLIIPAMGSDEFKKEFTTIFQEFIDKQYKIIDIKYQMASVYDTKEDIISSLYSALLIYVDPEPKGEENEAQNTEISQS